MKLKHRFNPIPTIIFIIIFSLFILSILDNFHSSTIDKKDNENNTSNVPNNSIIAPTINDDSFTKAVVKRVVDGDTIIAVIDNKEYRIRLIGINCPEYTSKIEVYGKEATEYTTKMLTGKTIYLEKDVSETDKYNRLLRYVWLQVPKQFSEEEIKNKMFNAMLVLNGYAQTTTYPPDVKYANHFKNFSEQARKNNVGLWNK